MTVQICDRCGDVTVVPDPCRCDAAHDAMESRRRHTAAVARARATDALTGSPSARRVA